MKYKFKMLFFLTLIGEFAFSAIDEYWQVYFNENLTINTAYYGWIIAISRPGLISVGNDNVNYHCNPCFFPLSCYSFFSFVKYTEAFEPAL